MFDLYSPLLLVAAAGLAVLIAGLFVRQAQAEWLPQWVSLTGGMLALVAVLVGVISHITLGHGPESGETLTVLRFLAIHPAPFIIAALASVGIALMARG
ncbi:MAG: hypothetical protein KJO54_00070 [Gammaproteobacteria bacterium]|nr:hypothetical protein [Gammaproteobacteria bacterium]NNF61997.1 hypothetical protein [Gammaproteobacteria bacterium]